MRIVIYSPLAANSAIGRVAVASGEELARRGHRVSFVRSEHDRTGAAEPHATALPVRWWHDAHPDAVMHDSDVILAHIGDNYAFHAGVLSILDGTNCLGIFHDFYLYNLFRSWAFDPTRGADAAALHERQVVDHYGGTAQDARRLTADDMPLEEIAERFPMTEWLASRCGAALAHAEFYAPRLDAACAGPVAVAPLCYASRDVPALAPRSGDDLVIATIGHINANKCCDRVIAALAGSKRLRSCRYRLVGPIAATERDRLEGLARDAGVSLDVVGPVSDVNLEIELARADILCCLRKPVLEGASASAIEAMMAGRPVVVADAGFYRDLPDDLVFKVPGNVPVPALTTTLERLAGDEAGRRDVAGRAREWARRHFHVEPYVTTLERLMQAFIEAGPYLKVGQRIGRDLADLGLSPDDPAVARIAGSLQAFFFAPPAANDGN